MGLKEPFPLSWKPSFHKCSDLAFSGEIVIALYTPPGRTNLAKSNTSLIIILLLSHSACQLMEDEEFLFLLVTTVTVMYFFFILK